MNDFITGAELERLCEPAAKLPVRGQVKDLEAFYVKDDFDRDKVCLLSGPKNTGKTTMMLQAIARLPAGERAKAAYLAVDGTQDISSIYGLLNNLKEQNFRYAFIDNCELIPDFITHVRDISNYQAMFMRIFFAGERGLEFEFTERDGLFGRGYAVNSAFCAWDGGDFAAYSRSAGVFPVRSAPETFCYKKEYLVKDIVHNLEKGMLECRKADKLRWGNLFPLLVKSGASLNDLFISYALAWLATAGCGKEVEKAIETFTERDEILDMEFCELLWMAGIGAGSRTTDLLDKGPDLKGRDDWEEIQKIYDKRKAFTNNVEICGTILLQPLVMRELLDDAACAVLRLVEPEKRERCQRMLRRGINQTLLTTALILNLNYIFIGKTTGRSGFSYFEKRRKPPELAEFRTNHLFIHDNGKSRGSLIEIRHDYHDDAILIPLDGKEPDVDKARLSWARKLAKKWGGKKARIFALYSGENTRAMGIEFLNFNYFLANIGGMAREWKKTEE